MNISVIGTGYVGLVTGACFAELGHSVICMDVDAERVKKVNRAESPIYEQGLDELLKKHVPTGRLRAALDIYEAVKNTEVTFICVGTPSGLMDYIDLKYVERVSRDIGRVLKEKNEFHVVVVKSTVVPGTTEHTVTTIIEEYSGKKAGKDFGIAMNPEFLREGSAVEDFMNPDRVVLGYTDERTGKILQELYKDFTCPIMKTTPKTAEMIKYATNSFLAVKISFINEIGNICKLLGIDVSEVAEGLGMDHRISPHFLRAGLGFGGSCFPKDVKALVGKAKETYYRPIILNAALEVNESQPLRLIELLERRVGNLRGKDVTVLGLAFKPDTDDMREAPSIKIIHTLLTKGVNVHAHDPKAIENAKKIFGSHDRLFYYEKAEDALAKSKYVLIITEWNEYRKKELYKGKEVFDGRRVLEAKELSDYYEGICW